MCDVFNGKINKGMEKPVIGCLEYIREYLMKRVCNVMKEMKNAKGPLSPTTTNILAARKQLLHNTLLSGMGETSIKSQELCGISMWWMFRNQTCTCRKWELIRIPCRHAIATLNEMSKDLEAELDIYKWVHKVYFLETWKNLIHLRLIQLRGDPCGPKWNVPQS
uniref:SWIM-type domain-containing protein n=1 Tax=Lactuca sativa TaxID=4236 RepID=A0A9R1WIS7_LACSA|nr:hypothetical protein LSAT_V11C100000840 [Lactuca sativa]